MADKEPKFMQELHKIRERLGRRYRSMSKKQLLQELSVKPLRDNRKAA